MIIPRPPKIAFWFILLFILIVIIFTEVLLFGWNYGISNGEPWDIFSIHACSKLIPLREGSYAIYSHNGYDMVHKIKYIYDDYVVFEDYFGERDKIRKKDIECSILFEIPIITTYGKQGFMATCYYQNYQDGPPYTDCEEYYKKHIERMDNYYE